jgi:hypothetical protein
MGYGNESALCGASHDRDKTGHIVASYSNRTAYKLALLRGAIAED